MGFGNSFIKWIRLLYRNPRCSVMVNGHISPFFFPSIGVRQRCPLSPLLYVLSMEVLACNVRASPVIQGITLPGLSTPLPVLSLYADDVSVIVSSDGAMEKAFYRYARFERGTGSKLNLDKCEGLWLGAGGVVQRVLCFFSGHLTKSRCWGLSLGTVTWRRRTGAPV